MSNVDKTVVASRVGFITTLTMMVLMSYAFLASVI